MCWSESSSARPTAQELLRHLQGSSHTWAHPLEYPIPDGHDEGAGLGLGSDDEWSTATGALTSRLFVLVVGMLCALLLPIP